MTARRVAVPVETSPPNQRARATATFGAAADVATYQAPSRLMTADDLADRWQVSAAQVYRLAREGRVPALRIGRYFRFKVEQIEAWEEAQ